MSAEELRNLVGQLQMDLMDINRQKEEGQGQIQRLQHKLEATENTVRHISRKLKSSQWLPTSANYQQVSPFKFPMARSQSETSLHRGDHWSRIYNGMLNGSGGGGGASMNDGPGFWYGGPTLLSRSTEWEPLPHYNNGGATHQDVPYIRAKSLSRLEGSPKQQIHQPPPQPNLQKVKTLSSSCILSSQAKHFVDGTQPTPFVIRAKGDIDKRSSLNGKRTPKDTTSATTINYVNNTISKAAHTSTSTSLTTTITTTTCTSNNHSVDSNPTGIPSHHSHKNTNKSSGGCNGNSQTFEHNVPHSRIPHAPKQYTKVKLLNSPQQIPKNCTTTITSASSTNQHEELTSGSKLSRENRTEITPSRQNSYSFATPIKGDIYNYDINNAEKEPALGKEKDILSNIEDYSFRCDSNPETEILNQLHHLLGEKEEMWRTKTMEIKHRMKKENFLLMQENELLQEEVKLLQENVNGLEKTIQGLRQINEVKSEDQRKLEEEIKTLKQEKAEIEEDLSNQDKELLDLDKTLCKMEITKKESDIQKRKKLDELEESKKELSLLKKELEYHKETNKSLKDNLIKRDASLQEQIFTVRKLRAEKSNDTRQSIISRTPDVIKTDVEFQFQRTNSLNEKHTRISGGYSSPMKISHNQEGQHELLQRIDDLKDELKVSLETTLKLKSEKERMSANLNIQIADLENQLADKEDLENRLAQTEFDLKSNKSLDEEISGLRLQLEKKFRYEIKMRNRVAESEAAVSTERTRLLVIQRELHETADKVKKRDKQCQELCEKFGKLDTAYIKQSKLLQEKMDTIDFLKKRLQIYEENNASKYSSKSIFTDERNVGSKL